MSHVLISFETPHHTIKADKLLEELKITKMVYPIPREISKDCGMGLRIQATDQDQVIKLFQEKGILYKKIFPIDSQDRLNLIERFSSQDQQK